MTNNITLLLVFAALIPTLEVFSACGPIQDDAPEVDGTVAAAALRSVDDNRLVVYTNNVENMLFDWRDLVHEMEVEAPPDLFLVQQLSGRDDLDRLLRFMGARLGVRYEGIVAQDHPTHLRFGGEVLPRPRVTTGIVYRADRFAVVSQDRWMPWGTGFEGQPQRCDARTNNSGYQTLRVKLHDQWANKNVVAVSLRHWTWHSCSTKNLKEIVEGWDGGVNDHAGLGRRADLQIVAGDFNDELQTDTGAYRCWYRMMNRELPAAGCADTTDLGFTDPLFSDCGGDATCVKKRSRIDFLFARHPDGSAVGTSHFDIVSWGDAHEASVAATGGDGPSNTISRNGYHDVGERYSGHRARRAWFAYE